MTMYDTGNPVGSTAPKDLSDNAQVLDKLVNGTDPRVTSRLGQELLSWDGITYEFQNAQDGREQEFQAFLAASAFVFIGNYGAGLNFTNRSQYLIRDGIAYRLAPSTTLPYTTTGNWAVEVNNFTPISSDDILRQDLAEPTGATLVGAVLPDGSNGTVQDFINTGTGGIYPLIGLGVGVDATARVQAAVDAWAANRNLMIQPIGDIDFFGTVQIPNKETDDPETALTFFGSGTFIKNNPGFMFTKKAGQQLPDGTPLQTGHVVFLGTRFRGAKLNGQTFVLDGDNIIRTKFVGCFGYGINLAYASAYLQSIYVDRSTVWRKWAGWLIDCGYLYDVVCDGTFEAGGSFIRTRDAAADPACNSLKVSANIEGLTGRIYSVGACFATLINGNYHEGNAGGDYDFSQGTAFHKGLTIMGCGFQPTATQLADPTYFPVKLGKGADGSITLIGNASTGNLFDVDPANQSAIVDMGNWVPSGRLKFSATSPRRHSFEGFKLTSSLLAGYGAHLDGYNSAVGFENTRSTVGGESVTAQVTYGTVNPQASPGSYTQVNWKAGTMVYSAAPVIAARQYGPGVTHSALIMGWQCVTSGAPGTWQEVAILLPY